MLVAEKYKEVWKKDGEDGEEKKDGEEGEDGEDEEVGEVREEKTGETVLREWVRGVKVRVRRGFCFVFCVGGLGGGGLILCGLSWN